MPEVTPSQNQIDWRQSAEKIVAFIRTAAQQNQTNQTLTPSAQTSINNQTLTILQARAGGTMSSYPPGTITRCDERVWVQTGRGHVELELISAQNQQHNAAEFLTAQGHAPGDLFDRAPSSLESQQQDQSKDAA